MKSLIIAVVVIVAGYQVVSTGMDVAQASIQQSQTAELIRDRNANP